MPIAEPSAATPSFATRCETLLRSDRLFVAHDVKLQMRRLAANGWPLPARFADTMIMSYVINPGLPSHAFGNVARDRLKQDVVVAQRRREDRAALRARSRDRLHAARALPAIPRREVRRHRRAAGRCSSRSCAAIRRSSTSTTASRCRSSRCWRGWKSAASASTSRCCARCRATMGAQLAELEKQIYAEAGTEFNINSPQQLGHILFEKLQYPVVKKTKGTKAYSTSVDVLQELAEPRLRGAAADPAAPRAAQAEVDLHRRAAAARRRATAACTRRSIRRSRRRGGCRRPIRTCRTSPSARSWDARSARRSSPTKGNVLLAADYSQVELRILAHISQDADLIETFRAARTSIAPRRRRCSTSPEDRADARSAPRGEDDQLRRAVRHVGVPAVERAEHLRPARRRISSTPTSRAIRRSRSTSTARSKRRARTRQGDDAVRARALHPRDPQQVVHGARQRRADGDERADPGNGRGHPEAGHDRARRAARRRGARCCSPCTTKS